MPLPSKSTTTFLLYHISAKKSTLFYLRDGARGAPPISETAQLPLRLSPVCRLSSLQRCRNYERRLSFCCNPLRIYHIADIIISCPRLPLFRPLLLPYSFPYPMQNSLPPPRGERSHHTCNEGKYGHSARTHSVATASQK